MDKSKLFDQTLNKELQNNKIAKNVEESNTIHAE